MTELWLHCPPARPPSPAAAVSCFCPAPQWCRKATAQGVGLLRKKLPQENDFHRFPPSTSEEKLVSFFCTDDLKNLAIAPHPTASLLGEEAP